MAVQDQVKAKGRARLSCVSCRQRKVRCDENIPCSTCVQRGVADQCRLPTVSPTPTKPTNSSQESTSSHQQRNSQKRPSAGSVEAIGAARLSSSQPRVEQVDTDPLAEIQILEQALQRLKAKLQPSSSSRGSSKSPWGNGTANSTVTSPSTPHEETRVAVETLVALLPSQQDCEISFDYLFQELDWVLSCTSSDWLQVKWSKFIYGGQITEADACCLGVHVAVASMMLTEAPHKLYPIGASCQNIHIHLRDYVWSFFKRGRPTASWPDTDECLTWLISHALAYDYFSLSGRREPSDWQSLSQSYDQMTRSWSLAEESGVFWDALSPSQRELARASVWTRLRCWRWACIYYDVGPRPELKDESVKIGRPAWPVRSPNTHFCAERDSVEDHEPQVKTVLPAPEEPVLRLCRLKDEQERARVSETHEVLMRRCARNPEIAEYRHSVKEWVLSQQSLPDQNGGSRKVALLHQGIALCEEIKGWSASLPVHYIEPQSVDPSDLLSVRQAKQASVIQIGMRQILYAITSIWLEETTLQAALAAPRKPSEYDSGHLSHCLLLRLREEALQNAYSMVAQIDLQKQLRNSPYSIGFGCWAAMALFNSALTLATPLLGSARLRRERMDNEARIGRLTLTDNFSFPSGPTSASNSTFDPSTAPSLGPSARSMLSNNISLTEMRTLAPHLLLILEELSMLHFSPLEREAQFRLQHLVKTYNISPDAPPPTFESSYLPFDISDFDSHTQSALSSFDESVAPVPTDAGGESGGGSGGEAGLSSILDSLMALDDEWWHALLAEGPG